MENENVIGKVCFAILRKGFVAGLRISLELDSPGCIIGCKFDGAGIVGNTVIDDSTQWIWQISVDSERWKKPSICAKPLNNRRKSIPDRSS